MPFILVSIVYWMANLNPLAYSFFICWIIIVLISNISAGYGTLISTLASTPEVALGLSSRWNFIFTIPSTLIYNINKKKIFSNLAQTKNKIHSMLLAWAKFGNLFLVIGPGQISQGLR